MQLVKFKEVSGTVWVSFESCDYREHINKRNEQVEIFFTIITTSIVHNVLNFNF